MDRSLALPILGFVSVLGLYYALGLFEGVPLADALGTLLLGVLAVTALAAGYGYARRSRGDDGDTDGRDGEGTADPHDPR